MPIITNKFSKHADYLICFSGLWRSQSAQAGWCLSRQRSLRTHFLQPGQTVFRGNITGDAFYMKTSVCHMLKACYWAVIQIVYLHSNVSYVEGRHVFVLSMTSQSTKQISFKRSGNWKWIDTCFYVVVVFLGGLKIRGWFIFSAIDTQRLLMPQRLSVWNTAQLSFLSHPAFILGNMFIFKLFFLT